MSKVAINLWFDKDAREAAELYSKIFPSSRITGTNLLKDTPSGNLELITMKIMGREFILMSAGPYFKMNPSISFRIPCKSTKDVESIWKELLSGGKVLMELGEYPFSKSYGWIQDKYGVSWQINLNSENMQDSTLTPVLMYTQKVAEKAEEAAKFYTEVFLSPEPKVLMREQDVVYGEFMIDKLKFGFMGSKQDHKFGFSEGISIIINCKNQDEIDYLWKNLSHVPEAEQCGWLKDKYGVSWQIVPENLDALLSKAGSGQLMQKFLEMKKIVIDELR